MDSNIDLNAMDPSFLFMIINNNNKEEEEEEAVSNLELVVGHCPAK